MDRQHVEIFVGENDRGALRHIVDAVMPGDVADAGQRRLLFFAQHRINLDEMDNGSIDRAAAAPEPRGAHPTSWCRGRGRVRPAAASAATRWPSTPKPSIAEQFAEHLADLGRGGEIALAAERIARHVVAVLGMRQAQLHYRQTGIGPDDLISLWISACNGENSVTACLKSTSVYAPAPCGAMPS